MAGKKGSRSSKTAHVLNLLSGGEAPEAPEQRPAAGTERTEEPQAGPTPPPPPRGRPILPPIVEVARTNSEALSETIRSALEMGELEMNRWQSYQKLKAENDYMEDKESYMIAKGKREKEISKLIKKMPMKQ